MPELDRKLKVACFLSFPRPLSGGGPATVSSHSWSSNPIDNNSSREVAQVSKRGARSAILQSSIVQRSEHPQSVQIFMDGMGVKDRAGLWIEMR